jgi:ubiquinone biosynthesis protein COQ9
MRGNHYIHHKTTPTYQESVVNGVMSKRIEWMTAPHNAIDPTAVAVMNATLLHVPFDGWSDAALASGAADAGVEQHMVSVLFPRGAIDAIALYSRLADAEMVAAFHALPETPKKIHLAIRALVLLRLELAQQNKDAVRRALTMLALPAHAKISAELLYETVDAMWRAAGQTDTGFSFYTRRATLAAVYSATLLAWLADNSGDMGKTVAFLDRRLANVASIPKATAPLRGVKAAGEQFARAMLKTIGRRHAR